MEELYFDKLGNFTEKDCKNIKEMMDGSTFYNYSVGWSNWASNCSLVVKADCGDEDKERAKKMFLYAAIGKGASAFSLADFLVRYGNAHIRKMQKKTFRLSAKRNGISSFSILTMHGLPKPYVITIMSLLMNTEG